jgi:AcrR family transcriptional regulator
VPRPKIYDDQLRRRLLDSAGRLITEHGVDALTLRRIAADSATSTSAIYALIGGRDELIRELFVEAFRSFGHSQATVPRTGDSAADLTALAAAYRTWALANPYLYQVMFGGVVGASVELTTEQQAECAATINPLHDVVDAGLADGSLIGGTTDELTLGFWGLVHGLVSLELASSVELPQRAHDRVFTSAARALIRGWQVAR